MHPKFATTNDQIHHTIPRQTRRPYRRVRLHHALRKRQLQIRLLLTKRTEDHDRQQVLRYRRQDQRLAGHFKKRRTRHHQFQRKEFETVRRVNTGRG